MKGIGTSIAAVLALAIFILVSSAFYIVDESSQAVLTLFGEPVTVVYLRDGKRHETEITPRSRR